MCIKINSFSYCKVSIADLCLVPQVYSAFRFNVDLTNYPTVRRIYDELDLIPEFRKAHAHTQPDTYPELRNKFPF